MFQTLSDKFQRVFSKLAGCKKLTEDNIQDAINDVRLALLDADVQYSVVKEFVKKVKENALGQEVLKAVSPTQQFVKIVHDELVLLMGQEEGLNLSFKPTKVLFCGLQGSGKTTSAVKLALLLKKQGKVKKPCVIACDLQRPAAVMQLKTLAGQASIDFYSQEGVQDPLKVAKGALSEGLKQGWDLFIFDTAGRLHVDEALMDELKEMKELIAPHEVIFVANAATGQEALKTAGQFHEKLQLTGSVMTMLDGSARGGAAITIRHVTGVPLKFEGVGEKIDDFQPFNPNSMADRILGMGDTINLVRKAQEHIQEEDAVLLEQKLRKATFTFEDYLKQMQMVKKMGSLKSLLGMIPGFSKLKELDLDEGEFFKTEAIILSMTPQERQGMCEMTIGRRKRIAKGSGVKVDDVHRLVKSFTNAKELFKNMPNKKQMEQMFGGSLWR